MRKEGRKRKEEKEERELFVGPLLVFLFINLATFLYILLLLLLLILCNKLITTIYYILNIVATAVKSGAHTSCAHVCDIDAIPHFHSTRAEEEAERPLPSPTRA